MSNTESAQTQWKAIAERLGFPDEPTMWVQLYIIEEKTIKWLADTMGFGTATIQRRLNLCGVERRQRGGANNPSRVIVALSHLDPRVLRLTPPPELAKLIGASVHSVYRVMKEM